MANRWSDDDVLQIFDWQERGLTAAQIAKLMNRSVASVQLKLSRTKDADLSIISMKELADQIGMMRNNLNNYLRKAGVNPVAFIKREHYFKIEDIQKLMDNGFALSIVIQNTPKKNRVWDMIRKSLTLVETQTTRNKVCKAFGVHSSVVGYWIVKSNFPKPLMNIHSVGHIFNKAEVEAWAQANNKTHGSLKISVGDFTANHLLDGELSSHIRQALITPITMFTEEG